MTSNRLFRNLIRQDYRNRVWLVSLLTIVYFLAYPVLYLTELSRVAADPDQYGYYALRSNVTNDVFSAKGYAWIFIFFAVICAVTGFSRLSSQKKIDYYHAMPLKRDSLYFAFFTSGWTIGIVPAAAAYCVAYFGIGGAFGQVNAKTAAHSMRTLLLLALLFTAVYAITVFAMVFTGRTVIGVLFAVMMLVYAPVCVSACLTIMQAFPTYWTGGITVEGMPWISPLILGVMLDEVQTGTAAIVLVLYAAAAILAGVLVYRHRPSETAGSAYVHPKIEPVIKVMVSIPAALLFAGAFCFSAFATGSSENRWTIIWALIGAALAGIVMDLVQSLDPSAILKHWRSALVILVSVAAAAIFMTVKPFDFDQYLPDESRIVQMGIACGDIDEVLSPMYQGDMIDRERETVQRTMTSDFSALYQLARTGKAYVNETGEDADDTDFGDYDTVVIAYRTKAGFTTYREYSIPKEEVRKAVASLSDDREYRKKLYQEELPDSGAFDMISINDWRNCQPDNDSTVIRLNSSERAELTSRITDDICSCGFGELAEEKPILAVSFDKEDENMEYTGTELPDLYIYPQYESTLSYLEELGYTVNPQMSVSELTEKIASAYVFYSTDDGSNRDTDISDPVKLEKLLGSIEEVRDEGLKTTSDLSVTLTFKDGDSSYPTFRIVDEQAFLEAVREG